MDKPVELRHERVDCRASLVPVSCENDRHWVRYEREVSGDAVGHCELINLFYNETKKKLKVRRFVVMIVLCTDRLLFVDYTDIVARRR